MCILNLQNAAITLLIEPCIFLGGVHKNLYLMLYLFSSSPKMFVIIKKGENVNAFVVGFVDAKMSKNGCNQKGIRPLKEERVQSSTI